MQNSAVLVKLRALDRQADIEDANVSFHEERTPQNVPATASLEGRTVCIDHWRPGITLATPF
jgi:hypothetical protein